ncbi:MAG: hypothetical protein DKM50_09715 [Candidatus Margulisiibacteriota bacterium]|nr:MAG: hypothetical protein A2X43_10175 [Candidatus Margulisbacteria bacterium GWD2_39_127]OGI01508.1 MAG: hypothetical protein A2X42_11995 [Candidatus Margulisbacteria bacterium GWF2_38_17]OGI11321.1 MAG: hypothetical protein A2X41_04345 [Candidatus Margulisbacteria bacterium GWE2_39_32]PZM78982.1 MAG: hypothetical protein DKM50_09715 [Candidatus Margulisiibacteriota bacterium]HAR64419.1 hypothetical protein [Candidatus Margulisiibacteriota bacterium]
MTLFNPGGLNFLIVDDSRSMRTVIKNLLIATGISIGYLYEADNGINALNIIRKENLDLIITDLNMPIMGGLDLLIKINNDAELKSKQIPAIVVSTEGSQDSVITAIKNGAKGYIRKPFDKDKLSELVQKVTKKN